MSMIEGFVEVSPEEADALKAMGIEVYWSGLKWGTRTPHLWEERLSCVRYKKVLGPEYRFYIKA